jgi:DinB family protein
MERSAKLRAAGEFPAILASIVEVVPEPRRRMRASDGGFSLVEHVWHVADLEEEGFGVRIERLLSETDPHLPDFPGARIARERSYIAQPLAPALARFAAARARNLARLDSAAHWSRRGTQEKVGPITLAGVLQSMVSHDVAHANELVTLLPEIGVAAPAELASFAARAPLARSA